MIHNLFPNDVYLEPIEHKYFDGHGNRYMSFSALYGKLVKKFDADKVSRMVAAGTGQNSEDIKESWNQATLNGSRIDKALELYAQTATILDSDQDLKNLVPYVLEKYKPYSKTFEQGVPYSKEYRVAGSWDKLSLVSSRKDSKFVMSDFKCFEKGLYSLFTVKGQSWLNAPFEHLPNNKFTKISFQLSFYSHLFEELTGRKCQGLFIDLIVPKWDYDNRLLSFENHVVNVNYLKNDVKILLEWFKSDILNEVSDIQVFDVESDELF